MPNDYRKNDFWKLYNRLSPELQEAVSSDETARDLENICKRHDVIEHAFDLVDYISRVLLGVLPPNELEKTLEKELGLEKELAKKVSMDAYRFIFHPVQNQLEQLYEIEIATPLAGSEEPHLPTEKLKPKKEASSAPPQKDPYRESLEE